MCRRLAATLLLFAVCCSLSTLTTVAQPATPKTSARHPSEPGTVSLQLRISVVDAETGRPVSKAGVIIRRAGKGVGGTPSNDIEGTTEDGGDFVRGDTEFQLDGQPYRLNVTAPGYKELELELPEAVLRESLSNERSLTMSVALSKISSPASTGSASNLAAVNKEEVVPVTNASNPPAPERRGFLASAASFLLLFTDKAIWWLGLVSVVALTAFGAAWFQGYHVEIRRGDSTGEVSADIYLRSIDERLANLKASLAAPVRGRDSHYDAASVDYLRQMDKRLARLDQLVSQVGVPATGVNDGAFSQTSERLARLEHDFAADLNRLSEAVKEIHGLVSTLVLEAWQAQELHTPEASPALECSPTLTIEKPQEWFRPRQQTERARQSYLGLFNAQSTGPEPIHLDSEGTSSVFGKLEDSNIYLQQVGRTQGTFVLFTEDNRTGYVFPHPVLAFQEKALREVFPGLTEAEFNGAKQRIEPVRVVRVGDRRWKVEHTILDID